MIGVMSGDLFCFTDGKAMCAVDLCTGAEVYYMRNELFSYHIHSPFLDYVVWPQEYLTSAPRSDSAAVFAGDIRGGGLESVFSVERPTDAAGVAIPSVLTYIDDVGDTIMVFQANNLYIAPYSEVIDVYSYNVTLREVEWHIDSLTTKSWNFHAPVMSEDNI